MASPIVAATAALMIQQDPSLNPAQRSSAARCRCRVRKARFGDPLVSGAGYLGTSSARFAPSPAVETPSPAAGGRGDRRIAFENTAITSGR